MRLPAEVRDMLKAMAGARNLTMEAAFTEAVEMWAVQGGKRSGKVTEEAKRMRAQCDQITGSGNTRVIGAAMVVLDGLCLMV